MPRVRAVYHRVSVQHFWTCVSAQLHAAAYCIRNCAQQEHEDLCNSYSSDRQHAVSDWRKRCAGLQATEGSMRQGQGSNTSRRKKDSSMREHAPGPDMNALLDYDE